MKVIHPLSETAVNVLCIAAASAVAVLVLGLPAMAAERPKAENDRWSVTDVGQVGDLAVRIHVLKQASLADEGWLAIEFDNRGKSPIALEGLNYNISAERFQLGSGTPAMWGGLGGGNDFDLFPRDGQMVPRKGVQPWQTPIDSGVHRIAGPPSDWSAASLGLPPKGGFAIKADLYLTIQVPGQEGFVKHTAFQFDWLYPDEAGFERARQRLKQILAQPTTNNRANIGQGHYLHTLLSIPEISRAVGVSELLAAIQLREGAFSGRDYVAEHLGSRFRQDPAVERFYQERLEAGDDNAAGDLYRVGVWQPGFREPLVKMFEKNPGRRCGLIPLILGGSEPDPQITERLSAACLGAMNGWPKKAANASPEELAGWAWQVNILASTRDRKLLPKFAPLLDDKTPLYKGPPPMRAADTCGRGLPTRVCDVALEAMLTILDGTPEKAYSEEAKGNDEFGGIGPPTAARDAAMLKVRDKLIAKLKAQWGKTSP